MNIIMFFRMVEQKLLVYIQKMNVLLKIINSIDRKLPTIILYIKKGITYTKLYYGTDCFLPEYT